MAPLYCTNFNDKTRLLDLAQLFSTYGGIDRIDMRSDKGYALVYFGKERHANAAIHALDGKPFGRDGLRLSVVWGSHVDDKASGQKPSKTLLVVDFNPLITTEHDLKRIFGAYGRVLNVSIHQNYALVQFETQEAATRALGRTHMCMFLGRVITVSYSNDDERRGRDDSPRRDDGRLGYGSSRRSPSPGYRQSRLSPDNVRQQRPGNDPSALRGGDDARCGRYDSPRRDDGRPIGYGSSRRSPSPGYRQSRLSLDNVKQQQRPVNDGYKDSGPSALQGGGRYDSPRRDDGRPIGYGSMRRSPSPGYHQSRLNPDNVWQQRPGNDRYKDYDPFNPSALQGCGRYDSPRRDDGRPIGYGSSRRSPSPGYRQSCLSLDNVKQQQRPVNDGYKDSGPSYARDMSP